MTSLPFVRLARLCCAVLFAIFSAGGLLTACSKFDKAQSTNDGPSVTAKFFDAQLTDVGGKSVDLSALRGKTAVVNFWAAWCPPCIEEIPMFNTVYQQWQAKNVVFVGIAVDQADSVKEFLQKTPVDYRIVVAEQAGADLARVLGNRAGAIPFTLIINPQQRIVARQLGGYSREALEAELAKVAQ